MLMTSFLITSTANCSQFRLYIFFRSYKFRDVISSRQVLANVCLFILTHRVGVIKSQRKKKYFYSSRRTFLEKCLARKATCSNAARDET